MNGRRLQGLSLFILRLVTGLYFVNFSLLALWTPSWSLNSFIGNAHTFPFFYQNLISSSVLPVIDLVIKFGFLIIGVLLIVGIFIRLASLVGIVFMLFLYFPMLAFPYVCTTTNGLCGAGNGGLYLVNSYLLVAAALFILVVSRANTFLSLGKILRFSRY